MQPQFQSSFPESESMPLGAFLAAFAYELDQLTPPSDEFGVPLELAEAADFRSLEPFPLLSEADFAAVEAEFCQPASPAAAVAAHRAARRTARRQPCPFPATCCVCPELSRAAS